MLPYAADLAFDAAPRDRRHAEYSCLPPREVEHIPEPWGRNPQITQDIVDVEGRVHRMGPCDRPKPPITNVVPVGAGEYDRGSSSCALNPPVPANQMTPMYRATRRAYARTASRLRQTLCVMLVLHADAP